MHKEDQFIVEHILPSALGDDGITATGAGDWVRVRGPRRSVSARLGASGTSATIEIHGSNDRNTVPGSGTWLGTIYLSGNNDPGLLSIDENCYYICQKTTAITGTAYVVAAEDEVN